MAEENEKIQRLILLQQVEILLETRDAEGLKALLADQWESDIAEIVESVDNDERRLIFDTLDREVSAEVLEKVNEATRDELFDLLHDHEIKAIFTELDHDDAADLIAELPDEQAQNVLSSLDQEDSEGIQELLQYSEDSAGGIMDPVLISVGENATVAEAVEIIRNADIDEDFYTIYVVDDSGRYVGDVRIRLLLTRQAATPIGDLVDRDTLFVTTDTDQEEVRNIFSKHDLIVIPVLDQDHHMVGRITADRVIEVAEEEAAEDVLAMAGTDPDELESESVLNAARIRMTWMFPCLLGTAVTAMVQIFFKSIDLHIYAAASVFAPMVAAISGNTGLQTSAVVGQGLATGHLAALQFSQVFTREVRVALLVALSCSILSGLVCLSFGHFNRAKEVPAVSSMPDQVMTAQAQTIPLHTVSVAWLAFSLSLAMFAAIMVSTTLGLTLPFLFKHIGIEPAISSGPIVTTANDSISVAIYMTLAINLAV
ncbi:MAG: magnesium transporter [Phycisphaeraceae bacterium]|nr:magnesium transporter [Phycisphaeraceae bacterium]